MEKVLRESPRSSLFPALSESNREQRVTSIFLSVLQHCKPFAGALLRTINLRVGARATIETFVEPRLLDGDTDKQQRPDGIIKFYSGRGEPVCIFVEAKIGNNTIKTEQVEGYCTLAKQMGVTSLVTISNEFAALPELVPYEISKAKQKGIKLYHWSWMSILTQASLLLEDKDLDDGAQRFLVEELLRFLSHESTGVSSFTQMNPEWADVIQQIGANANLRKTDSAVLNTVAAWHQETRDIALLLSRETGQPVRISLTRGQVQDASLRVKNDATTLCDEARVSCDFLIPNAAAPMSISANLARRVVSVSMKLAAPEDLSRIDSRINWIKRQLAGIDDKDVYIRAYWPGRAAWTQAPLSSLTETNESLFPSNRSLLPHSFEVLMICDLQRRFSGRKTFVQDVEALVPDFYGRIGQRLRKFQARPPKLKKGQDDHEPQNSEDLAEVPIEPASDD